MKPALYTLAGIVRAFAFVDVPARLKVAVLRNCAVDRHDNLSFYGKR